MDDGGPVVAGQGGEDVIEWGKLQLLKVKEREIVFVTERRDRRPPHASAQVVEEGGVRVEFETRAERVAVGWQTTKRKGKMPENSERTVLNYEGRRYT